MCSTHGRILVTSMIFNALNAGQSRQEKAIVRPSVKGVYCDITDVRSLQIFIPYERSMVDGGHPFYLKFWVKLAALERNRR